MSRTCQFPGCTADISHRAPMSKYCIPCGKEMHKRRHRRGRKARAVREYHFKDEGRQKQDICKVCYGMPWARTPERFNESSGHGLHPVTKGDRRCVGCGELYQPEPAQNMGSAIASSAGTMADHGALYGSEILVRKG